MSCASLQSYGGVSFGDSEPTTTYRRRSSSFPSKEMICVQNNDEVRSLQKRLCKESCYSCAYTSIIEDIKQMNATTQDTQSKSRTRQKKRKLRLSVSCPPFSTCEDPSISPSSCEEILSGHNTFTFQEHKSSHVNEVTNQVIIGSSTNVTLSAERNYTIQSIPHCSKLRPPKEPITYQPGSADYIAFIKQSEHVHDIRYLDSLKRESDCSTCLPRPKRVVTQPEHVHEDRFKYLHSLNNVNDCANCLTKAKNVISWCTCHWCLMSLCYHCVYRDDVGYNTPNLKDILTCEGSMEKNFRRTAIMVSCLPCLPCLSLYPLLNSILNLCLKFS